MAATDDFSYSATGLGSPAKGAETITPDDANELGHVTRALYVGSAGNIAVVMANGDTVTFTAVPVGAVLSVRVKQVMATGTTATNLIGLR